MTGLQKKNEVDKELIRNILTKVKNHEIALERIL
jgi:hypothetical protein